MIVSAELIKPFTAPEWTVERLDKICDAGDLRVLNEALGTGRAEIVASDLLGHPPYTHIIRYHYQDGATDFLAQIDTSGYLVQLPEDPGSV